MTEHHNSDPRLDTSREIRAPHGTTLRTKSWLTEAPLRMLMNNLDPDVAEHPHSLVVYGGIGRAARDWKCFDTKGTNYGVLNAMIRCVRILLFFFFRDTTLR